MWVIVQIAIDELEIEQCVEIYQLINCPLDFFPSGAYFLMNPQYSKSLRAFVRFPLLVICPSLISSLRVIPMRFFPSVVTIGI